MRQARVWKRLLGVEHTVIEAVDFDEDDDLIVVAVRPTRSRRSRCGICGGKAPGYDQGEGRRRWRALDLGTVRAVLEADAPRVTCRVHGVVVAGVPWARHGAGHTAEFDATVAWLATVTSKSAVCMLMRVAWRTVGAVLARVWDDTGARVDRFAGLRRIGIDEISYKRGHKYLTVVVDHDTGRLVWAAPGRDKATLEGFFDLLGPGRSAAITHVSADGAGWIASVVAARAPQAITCADAFHVVAWATEALDEVRRQAWNDARGAVDRRRAPTATGPAKTLKRSRWALWKNPANLTPRQRQQLEWIARTDPRLYRAYLLKTFPSIAYVGRESTDPLGTMPQAESTIIAGTGSQTGTEARWGDYSAMAVDPVDDCTFWYTNEYVQTTGPRTWRTRIARFTFPSCMLPDAPSSLQAVPGDGQIAVSWAAPGYTGSSAITNYTATADPGGSTCTAPIPGPTTCTITGLSNGTSYVVSVVATNAGGSGAPATSAPVTPATIPSPPSSVSAVAGDGLAVASWASGGDGGSAITSYAATASPGGATCTTPAGASPAPTSCTITGLVNGADYTVTVTATNVVGTSVPSAASAPVRPAFAVLQVTVTPTTVKPGGSVAVNVGQAGPGCTLTFGLSGSSATSTASAAGTASGSVVAPNPNGPYQVTVVQGGAGCPALSATAPVTVSGPYITGPTKVKKGKKVTFTGKEFTKKKKVSWTVTRKGEKVASGSGKASKKGVATFKVFLSKKGTYTVTAKQKSKKATYSVKVT